MIPVPGLWAFPAVLTGGHTIGYPSRTYRTVRVRTPFMGDTIMVDRLNDLTREEIAEIRARRLDTTMLKTCAWCGEIFRMKKAQSFCTPAHKAAYHRHAEEILHAAMLKELEASKHERDVLIKEITLLRRVIAEAGLTVPEST